jgi:hypothetical protein
MRVNHRSRREQNIRHGLIDYRQLTHVRLTFGVPSGLLGQSMM